jgi:hypothetical protein
MISLLVPLTEGRSLGWPLWTWLLLAISPIAALATYLVERRTERLGGSPLLPPSLLSLRSMRTGIALGLPFFLGFGGFMFVFSITVQRGMHQDALHSGLAITPLAIMFFIGSLLTPRLIARYGRTVITLGSLLQALSLAVLVAVVLDEWPNVGLLDLVPSLAGAGFGASLVFGSLFRVVLADVPTSLAGVGSGVMVTLQQCGFAFGVATLGSLFLGIEQLDISAGFGVVVAIEAAIGLFLAAGSFLLPASAVSTPSAALVLQDM